MRTLHLLPLFALSSITPLSANGGGYITGIKSTGPFRPVNVESVEMVSEKLDIELKAEAAFISIVYQLHNPGAAVEVEMGFPCAVGVNLQYKEGGGGPLPVKSLPQLESFTLTADGKAVASKLVRDHAVLPAEDAKAAELGIITGWQVVKIPFAAGQTCTVAVNYRNPWYREVSYMSDNMDKSAPEMSYLFSAAGLWKGAIKSGEVTVRATGINPDEVQLSHPKRFTRAGRTWTWNFTDFEPTMQDDLEIVVGQCEFSQCVEKDGRYLGAYAWRGGETDLMQKAGKWFFLSNQFTATASSRLKPEKTAGGLHVTPKLWEAMQRSLPWVEGAKGDGIGESVTLTMEQPVKASRLIIQNGARDAAMDEDLTGMSPELFQQKGRVKKLGVSVNGGASFSVELPDSYFVDGIVELPQDAGELKTVKLTIEEAWAGTKCRETCIAGVQVEIPLSKPPVIRPSR